MSKKEISDAAVMGCCIAFAGFFVVALVWAALTEEPGFTGYLKTVFAILLFVGLPVGLAWAAWDGIRKWWRGG